MKVRYQYDTMMPEGIQGGHTGPPLQISIRDDGVRECRLCGLMPDAYITEEERKHHNVIPVFRGRGTRHVKHRNPRRYTTASRSHISQANPAYLWSPVVRERRNIISRESAFQNSILERAETTVNPCVRGSRYSRISCVDGGNRDDGEGEVLAR